MQYLRLHSLDRSLETESLESTFHMSETETESSEEEHPYVKCGKTGESWSRFK